MIGATWIEEHYGKWRLRSRPGGRRGRKLILGTFDTREEAERMLRAHRAEVAEGAILAPGEVTLRLWSDTWLDTREVHDSVRGIERERSVFELHVRTARFADWPLEAIAARDVQAWVREMCRKPAVSAITTKGPAGEKVVVRRPKPTPLSRTVVKHALRLLRQCLDAAEVEGLVASNAARAKGVAIPKVKDVGDPCWTVYTPAELEALTAPGVLRDPSRHAIAIAFFTGIRQSHLRLQEWADVELDALHPRITIRDTKGGKVHRVALLPVAAEWLRAWRAHSESGERYLFESSPRTAYSDGYDWGWAGKTDGDTRYPSALERAGLEGRSGRFHDLRHSFISHLLMGTFGVAYSIEEAAQMAGHSTAHITERYAHLLPSHLDRKASAASTILVSPRGNPDEGPEGNTCPRVPPVDSAKCWRTLEDSNFRPSAPEADASLRDLAALRLLRGTRGGTEVARRVIEAAAAGESPEPEDLQALADLVLETPEVRAALDVRAGGPWALVRALDLAGWVLERDGAGVGEDESEVG